MERIPTRVHPAVTRLLDIPFARMEALTGLAGERARAMYLQVQQDFCQPDCLDTRFTVSRATYCLLALRAADTQPKGHSDAAFPPFQP